MKKYLTLFFVALFATMSFALTSCGDDNDEPDGGDDFYGPTAISINNQDYVLLTGMEKFVIGANEIETNVELTLKDIAAEQIRCASLEFKAKPTNLKKGAEIECTSIKSVLYAGSQSVIFSNYSSGSITVGEYNGEYITLKFNNFTVTNEQGKKQVFNGHINYPVFE